MLVANRLLVGLDAPSASHFRVGDTVQVVSAERGFEDYIGRLGTVKLPSEVAHLAHQVRVLLDGDVLIQRFMPEQLRIVYLDPIAPAQQALIESYERQGWSVVALPHPLVEQQELCLQFTKARQQWLLFIRPDGWTETEPQKVQLREWRSQGWELSLKRLSGMELLVHLSNLVAEKTVILAGSGDIAEGVSQLPTPEHCETRSQIETAIAQIDAADNRAVVNGGMAWSNAWGCCSIQEYSVLKRLKNVDRPYWYHRLESHKAIFPAKRGTKSGSPYTKKFHIPRSDYSAYRSAKFRYDLKQSLLKKLETFRDRQSSITLEVGDWAILDTRDRPRCSDRQTFSYLIVQYQLVDGVLVPVTRDRIAKIPNTPDYADRAHAIALAKLQQLKKLYAQN